MKTKRIWIVLLALLLAAGLAWRLLPRGGADGAGECTISVRCDTLLAHRDELDPAVASLVPADGVLLEQTQASFAAGESVFDVLRRETRARGIPMEFSETPLYGAVYVEGIGNLYEFDCGPLSGWMYRVNGEFPSFGSSQYRLADGDAVEWVYTCDLGSDVGNQYNAMQK